MYVSMDTTWVTMRVQYTDGTWGEEYVVPYPFSENGDAWLKEQGTNPLVHHATMQYGGTGFSGGDYWVPVREEAPSFEDVPW